MPRITCPSCDAECAAEDRFCEQCGGALAESSRYCARCGRATRRQARLAQARAENERARDRRTILAVLTLYGGVLLGIAGLGALDSVDTSLAGASRPSHVVWSLLAVATTIGIAFAWIAVLDPDGSDTGGRVMREFLGRPFILFAFAILPAVFEEWLDRGVLWHALSPHLGRTSTILATSLLFALTHGLNGAYLLELPHRFLIGVVLGILRARTGSLLPSIYAHFLHNCAFLLVF